MKIFGIGEIVLDIIFKNGHPVESVAGGSVFNSMVSLGRTVPKLMSDVTISMISTMGDDMVADMVFSFMKENNLNCEFVKRVKKAQSVISLAFLNENSDSVYEFYRDVAINSEPYEIDSIQIESSDIILMGSYFAISPSTCTLVKSIVQKAKKCGALIFYDLNFRKNHLSELYSLKSVIDDNISSCSIVRASSEDLYNVYGTDDPVYVYNNFISPLCDKFICTGGGHAPTCVFWRGKFSKFYPKPLNAVSTIGAGDSFNAGVIYALLKEGMNVEFEKIFPIAASFSSNVCMSISNYVDSDFLG